MYVEFEENVEYFMSCEAYGKVTWDINCKEIFATNISIQNIVAKEIKRRQFIRKRKLEKVGLPPHLAPLLQASVELKWL